MARENPKCSIQRLIAVIWIRPQPGPDPKIIYATRPDPQAGSDRGPSLCRPLASENVQDNTNHMKPLVAAANRFHNETTDSEETRAVGDR
jgi:hypothetical protein